jgi:uncharacterized membrane protein YhaH (DUF805 family)
MKWYLHACRNFVNFNGRAGRTEYWLFALFNAFFASIAIVLDISLKTSFTRYGESLSVGWIYTIYSLLVLLPSLSVTLRRLHDTGRNGWNFLIPVVSAAAFYLCLVEATKKAFWHETKAAGGWATGGLVLLCLGMILFTVLLLLKGDDGPNRFGERSAATANAHEHAADALIMLLVLGEACSRITGYLWSIAGNKLSKLANTNFSSYRKLQESFVVIANLLGFLSLFALMGLTFVVKDKRKRTVLFIITVLLALLQVHYCYTLITRSIYGE